MEIKLATREDIMDNWGTLSVMFKRAMDKGQGESTLMDHLQKLMNYQSQCWLIIEDYKITGAGITEILQYSQHKTLHIILFTGEDFVQQSTMLPIVEDFAKKQGCVALEQWGRSGWEKVLPKVIPGFNKVYSVFRKELL